MQPETMLNNCAVLELTVSNHPGVMSQVCGLFSRRAYNVEAILCLPVNGGDSSRIWLVLAPDQRLDQITKQVAKLHDVLDIHRRDEAAATVAGLGRLFES